MLAERVRRCVGAKLARASAEPTVREHTQRPPDVAGTLAPGRRAGAGWLMVGLCLLACMAADAYGASAEWPSFRGDAGLTGVAEGEALGHLELAWTYDAGGMISGAPAIAGGLVYVGSTDGGLHAVRLDDGTFAWRYEAGEAVNASPAYADGVVYVGDEIGRASCRERV